MQREESGWSADEEMCTVHEKSITPFINIVAYHEYEYDYSRMENSSRVRVKSVASRSVAVFNIIFIGAVFFIAFSPVASAQTTLWSYTFNVNGTLLEAGSMNESSSPYFWLNSGGKMIFKGGVGVLQGALPSNDPARLLYASMNPLDTSNGYYPQNTLRLVTKKSWGNIDESIKFKIVKTNLTDTPNRDGYSGVFLFGRYKDSNNLYYVGIRQDGQAVIKKKINGTYHTLAEKQVFGSQDQYNRTSKPNLMPQGQWMRLRASFENLADGSVRIKMYLDKTGTGSYSNIITATDKGIGGAPITASGKAGVRTDFMDMQFDDYVIRSVN
jgi:hypothetical protein